VGLAVVVDSCDSTMDQTASVARFGPKSRDEFRGRPQLVLEDLDSNRPGQHPVGTFPDLPHPADGDRASQDIAATEDQVRLGPHTRKYPSAPTVEHRA